ncbi:MAG: hypothetical protein IKP10_06875 [Clostridia bacterium]|nr:hypothetical protein [Clostridia bacterium]
MGSRGTYSQKGGFSRQDYRDTGDTIKGFKVIEQIKEGTATLPQMSNTPGTVYIFRTRSGEMKIGIYGQDRRITKEIEISHGHRNKYNSGKKQRLKKGVAHVHNWHRGRENNTRYMTKKEIKIYGKAVLAIGGKLRP